MGTRIMSAMTKKEAIEYFGTQVKLGAALGNVHQPTISRWGEIPTLYQLQLEVITNGDLRADASCDLYRVKAA